MRRLKSIRGSVAFGLGLCVTLPAWGQTFAPGTQIRTDIRPIVSEQYSGGNAGVAIGIFDSGDPRDTLARETARSFAINVTTPVYTNAVGAIQNFGTTAAQ